MALLCVGLFAGAMALKTIQPATEPSSLLWNSYQFGLPIMIAGVLLTGKRWAYMTGVIYGTIGMALDIAT